MSVAIHLKTHEAKLFKKHAARRGMTLSDFAAASMRERMEDELDRQAYALEDVEKELGLS